MLFRWQEDALSVLPALPERLKTGSVRGMVFPGGTIDFSWRKPGEISVIVHAERESDADLLIGRKAAGTVKLRAGESGTWTEPC